MYNLTLVTERLNIIRNAVKRLRVLAEMPAEEFCHSEDAVDIAENRLRRAIEALFDLGRHMVVKSGAGLPPDYRSVIQLLRENNILPENFARRIEGMAGYRNRIVHDYNKVTPEELYQILNTRLSDFELFCKHIADYLQK
ncbi:MAG: DUF86 domain-containing protein [Actinobacteria bacterium]|nr:DUF86 domain-containing protein [Actinomycetota bacterium]